MSTTHRVPAASESQCRVPVIYKFPRLGIRPLSPKSMILLTTDAEKRTILFDFRVLILSRALLVSWLGSWPGWTTALGMRFAITYQKAAGRLLTHSHRGTLTNGFIYSTEVLLPFQ